MLAGRESAAGVLQKCLRQVPTDIQGAEILIHSMEDLRATAYVLAGRGWLRVHEVDEIDQLSPAAGSMFSGGGENVTLTAFDALALGGETVSA